MPKKQSTFFFITAVFFLLLSGLFISCKSELTDQAPVSFSLPQKMFRMAGDFFETEDGEEDYNFTLMVKLVDSSLKDVVDPYEETKKISEWEEALDNDEGSYSVTFEKVPVGSEVYAMVSLYATIDGKKVEFFNGNSESLLVEEGSNSLSVKLANVIPKVKVNFVFQETFGGTTYNENEKFPALILNFFGDTDIEHMAVLTKTIMAAYMAGYQVNEEKMPETPEIQKDGTYAMTIYFDLIGATIPGSGSISYNLDYSPLTISIDKDEINMFGDTITVTVKDKDGNTLDPEDLQYGVSLFYKGKEVNNSEFLKLDGSQLKVEPLVVSGDYTLFVVVLYMKDGVVPVIGSKNFNFYARLNITPELYISASGSLDNDGFSIEKTLPSIESVNSIIAKWSLYFEEAQNWTINVVGKLAEPQILSTKIPRSITIKGIKNGDEEAEINASTVANEDNPASALAITSSVPVTIQNIKITGGYADYGGGINSSAPLTIDEGVLITGNHATSSGGGVKTGSQTFVMKGGTITGNIAEYGGGGVYSEGEMFMYGKAVIGDKNAESSAVYDADNPSSNSYGNLCLDTENSSYSGGGGINCNDLYLGYSGRDEYGNLIEAELKGGVYKNYAVRNGGGIRVDSWKKITMSSGNISYNATAGNGNGIWLTPMSGKLIVSGAAEVNENNDVYLPGEYNSAQHQYYSAWIEVAGPLSKEKVAAIAPGSEEGYQIIKLADGIDPDVFGYTYLNQFIPPEGKIIVSDVSDGVSGGKLSDEP